MDIQSLIEDIEDSINIINSSLKRIIFFCIAVISIAILVLFILSMIRFSSEINKNIAQLGCASIASTPLLLFRQVNDIILKKKVLKKLMNKALKLRENPTKDKYDEIHKKVGDFFSYLLNKN